MIVDTHVHIWEISDKYPIGPTAPTWNSYPDEPGTAEELLAEMDAEGSGLDSARANELVHLGQRLYRGFCGSIPGSVCRAWSY